MRALQRLISSFSVYHSKNPSQFKNPIFLSISNPFSSTSSGNDGTENWAESFGSKPSTGSGDSDNLGWDDSVSSWSTGLTKEHFDGEVIGKQVSPGQGEDPSRPVYGVGGGQGFGSTSWTKEEMDKILQLENNKGKAYVDSWSDRMKETSVLLKQVREPGARGTYLKDSEKAEMYKKHKENPEEYTVERLAKEYRIMRQRVHAILWLKELEEEEEKKLGCELDDSVELLLDACPELVLPFFLNFIVSLTIKNSYFVFLLIMD